MDDDRELHLPAFRARVAQRRDDRRLAQRLVALRVAAWPLARDGAALEQQRRRFVHRAMRLLQRRHRRRSVEAHLYEALHV